MFFNGQHVENVPAATQNSIKKIGNRQTNCPFLTIFGPPTTGTSLVVFCSVYRGFPILWHQNLSKKDNFVHLPTGFCSDSCIAAGPFFSTATDKKLVVGV